LEFIHGYRVLSFAREFNENEDKDINAQRKIRYFVDIVFGQQVKIIL